MTHWWNTQRRRQKTALLAVGCMAAPLLTAPAGAQIFGKRPPQTSGSPSQGMSTKKKLVALAGAALVYYLFKKHQAKRAEAQRQAGRGQLTTVNQRMPQLYRSKNGGIYYRDPNGKPVWLTAPTRSVQVPYEEVQRYAPDYDRYRGPAPSVPAGARTRRFDEFNGGLFTDTSYNSPAAPRRPMGSGGPSGPPGR